jgi:DNA replicative helicase MCM subunit Mcm2 (Cdc46/Mcm family)|tara:strand:+ start:4418 stop:5104 length:687 start_codon:yes stop_codon:yes gene_type:complete
MSDNQLNTQMNNMINEFNKQRDAGFICDTKCQNNQTVRDWQHKVVQKEDTLANASKSLLNAQRQLASYDSSYKPTFNTNINDMADQEIEKLQTQFETAYNNIIQNLDFYDTQIALQNSLLDIKQYQQNKLDDISGNVARNTSEVAVNRRQATFYSKETSVLDITISYLRIIYWTLFVIQIIASIMFVKNEKEDLLILTIVLLAIFPLYNTLYPILKNIITAFGLFPTP